MILWELNQDQKELPFLQVTLTEGSETTRRLRETSRLLDPTSIRREINMLPLLTGHDK